MTQSPPQIAAQEHLKLGRLPGPRTPAQTANLVKAREANLKKLADRRDVAGGSCLTCGGVNGHPYKHGSSGYAHGCKCDICMEWMRENGRRKYAANLDKRRAQAKARYDAAPERHQEYQRKWAAQHPEQVRESVRLSRQKHGQKRDPRTKRRGDRRCAERFSRIPGPRNNSPWTPQEDAIALLDISIVAICYRLGRSYSAVQHRRSRLQKAKGPQ